MLSTHDLNKLISTGDHESLHKFFSITLPFLPKDSRAKYCLHPHAPCTTLPCPSLLYPLLLRSVEQNLPNIFTYLWDTYPSSHPPHIPWSYLRACAQKGWLGMGKVFWERDKNCFQVREPRSVHGTTGGETQINVAMRNGCYDYVDFMLERGADINAGYPERSVVRAAVMFATTDDVTEDRVRFLVERGARVSGTGALEAAQKENLSDVVHFLEHSRSLEREVMEESGNTKWVT